MALTSVRASGRAGHIAMLWIAAAASEMLWMAPVAVEALWIADCIPEVL